MKIDVTHSVDIKIRPSKQLIDDVLDVPLPFMNKCGVYVIAGSMGSGKSSFTNSIMTGTGKARVFRGVFDEVHYVTPKEAFDSEALHPFRDHPIERIYGDLSPQTFAKIKLDCTTLAREGGTSDNSGGTSCNSCLIIDDMSEFLKVRSIELALKELIFKHRHYKLNIIITLLTLKSLPKSLRSLVDCFILFKPKSTIEIQSFADDVFALGKDDLKSLFEFVFDEPYRFLFYNQRSNTYYKDFDKLQFSN